MSSHVAQAVVVSQLALEHRQRRHDHRLLKGERDPRERQGRESHVVVLPRLLHYVTKSATPTYWHAAAATTSAWKISWYPKTDGMGSGRFSE